MDDKDKEFLERIFNNDKRAISAFYNEYSKEIERKVFSLGGSEDDAQDVFQETIIIVYELRKENKLLFEGKFKAYFCGIAKNIYLKEYRRKKIHGRFVESKQFNADGVDMEALFDKAEKYRIFYKHFNRLSEVCKQLLREDAEKKSHAEMAAKLGYTANYSKVKKNSCKRTLCQNVLNDPEYNEYKSN